MGSSRSSSRCAFWARVTLLHWGCLVWAQVAWAAGAEAKGARVQMRFQCTFAARQKGTGPRAEDNEILLEMDGLFTSSQPHGPLELKVVRAQVVRARGPCMRPKPMTVVFREDPDAALVGTWSIETPGATNRRLAMGDGVQLANLMLPLLCAGKEDERGARAATVLLLSTLSDGRVLSARMRLRVVRGKGPTRLGYWGAPKRERRGGQSVRLYTRREGDLLHLLQVTVRGGSPFLEVAKDWFFKGQPTKLWALLAHAEEPSVVLAYVRARLTEPAEPGADR